MIRLTFALALVVVTGIAEAASLADQLDGVLRRKAFQAVDVDVPVLVRTVVRGADFPVSASTPDFTYRYDPDVGVPQRVERSPGPIFTDTAETVGARIVELGLSFLHVPFATRDGHELPGITPRFRFVSFQQDRVLFLPGRLQFTTFDLESSILTGSVTYGVTSKWDVGVLVQAVRTSLDVRGTSRVKVDEFEVPLTQVRIADTKNGIGDVLVRTKYVLATEPLQVASTLQLRLPTGNERNFQGLGDYVATPSVVATYALGPHAVSGSLGADVDADDLQRCRLRYGIAASIFLWKHLSLLAEVDGSSGFVADEFVVNVRQVAPTAGRFMSGTRDAAVSRADIVDGALGFKIPFGGSATAYAAALVPLTRDGVRADVVPTVGVQATF